VIRSKIHTTVEGRNSALARLAQVRNALLFAFAGHTKNTHCQSHLSSLL